MAFRLLLAAFLSMAIGVQAAEVSGVRLDDKAQVESKDLVLNGAGLRKRFIFSVYVLGLYLPEKKTDAAAVLQLPGPKRALIHMMRDVSADQFTEAMLDGLRPNVSEAEYNAIEPRLKQLMDLIAETKEAKKGMTIAIDWTGSATRLAFNGSPVGKPIPGEDLYRALLRIWLGDKPVQDDLKKALLGG
jgi:hypothetical protein